MKDAQQETDTRQNQKSAEVDGIQAPQIEPHRQIGLLQRIFHIELILEAERRGHMGALQLLQPLVPLMGQPGDILLRFRTCDIEPGFPEDGILLALFQLVSILVAQSLGIGLQRIFHLLQKLLGVFVGAVPVLL